VKGLGEAQSLILVSYESPQRTRINIETKPRMRDDLMWHINLLSTHPFHRNSDLAANLPALFANQRNGFTAARRML
jgi:hypothetical protein